MFKFEAIFLDLCTFEGGNQMLIGWIIALHRFLDTWEHVQM